MAGGATSGVNPEAGTDSDAVSGPLRVLGIHPA